VKEQYVPRSTEAKLAYLVEECGETLAAVGKSQRFGLSSFNPELLEAEREENGDWVLRELVDLERAIGFVREDLARRGYCVDAEEGS
jgi:NTP pyrophosphatase (non-canonical NTP hydrolase)